MVGRKTKLTEDLIREASNLIKAGNYTDPVCQYLGIHKSTWYKWLAEGETAKSGLKRTFYDEIKMAESHAEIRNVNIIQTAAKENWQASAWYLERKFHDRWGRKDKTQVEHSGGVTNRTIDMSSLSVEELRKLAQLDEETEE